MTESTLRLTLLALLLSLVLGGMVGALSQMTAVSVSDPRPSAPLPATPIPTASPISTPSPTATATATATATPAPEPEPSPSAEGADVWLYTIAEGDSISLLAIRYGTTTEELLLMNPEYADSQDLVETGAQIILPCTPIAVAEARC